MACFLASHFFINISDNPNTTKNAPNIYKMATLEQKSKIIELLFSKVVIHPKVGKEHQVDFHYNPNVEQMFKRKKTSPDKQ